MVPTLPTLLIAVALGQATQSTTLESSSTAPTEQDSLLKRLKYTALVDAFATGHIQSGDRTAMRVFDTGGNSFELSYAKVGLWLDADPVGFRFDIGFGQTIDVLSVDTTIPVIRQFEQLYVSGKLPIHRGITVDFGRFLTCVGNETVDSRQSWTHSRSLLFGFAQPATHTGFRVTAPLSDAFTVTAGAVQGWDIIVDNNPGKTFFLSTAVTLNDSHSFSVSAMTGPEQATGNTWRTLIDGVYTAKLPANFELGANLDAGFEGVASWYGAAISGHFTAGKFDFAARVEAFNDPQNTRFKLTAPSLAGGALALEGTVSARVTINQFLQARAEYRHDQFIGASSVPQDTVTLAVAAGI
jgi:hypothetical protein